jgi:hypothetical protein
LRPRYRESDLRDPGHLAVVTIDDPYPTLKIAQLKVKAAFSKALNADGPTVIAVPIKHQIKPLVPPVSPA